MTRTLAALCLLTISTAAQSAITLSLDPANQEALTGSSFDVRLIIAGLGGGGPPSLGTFDVDVSFDPSILSFNTATFGDPLLGDQLDLGGLGSVIEVTSKDGTINLFELSLDSAADLDTLQTAGFVLATMNFKALTTGSTVLTPSVKALGDALGDPLMADSIRPAVATVSPIPEQTPVALIAAGLLVVIGLAKVRHMTRK